MSPQIQPILLFFFRQTLSFAFGETKKLNGRLLIQACRHRCPSYGLQCRAAVALSTLRFEMADPDPICARLHFRNPGNQTEQLVPEWTPEQVNVAKNRSALLKPLILYLRDDDQRGDEAIQFLPERDGAEGFDDWADQTDPTRIPRCVDLEEDLKSFLRRGFLTSDEPVSSSRVLMSTFCKCAWICRAPPEVFLNCPSRIVNNPNRKTVLASAPVLGPAAPPASSQRLWQMPRDCGCHDDTCACSAELAEICLWLGWRREFERHLRAAIWSGSIGSVDLITPMRPLRNLRSRFQLHPITSLKLSRSRC